jgi:cell wall-associated NlpC family hydrolase
MRTPGTFILCLAVSFVLWTNSAAAQQKMVRTFQMHVDAEEEVWPVAPAHAVARDVVLRLGHELRWSGLDCSHLVHQIYQRAGLPYDYAPSRDLYDGVDAFRRVYHPLAGDIVVWRGHVGIVVNPDERSFLSALRSGVKVSDYATQYWKRRGQPRFYRYALTDGQVPDWSRNVIAGQASAESE